MSRNLKWLARQETSTNVGDFTGLTGASFEEIFPRAPKDWKVVLQNDGKGIKFVDKDGVEKVRIHAPENNPNLPSTANTNNGWVLRIPADKEKNLYFDDTGKILKSKTNETHIPIKGNPNAN